MTTAEQPPVDVHLESKEEQKPEASAAEPAAPRTLPIGPIEGVEYPLKVVYCGVCSLPVEYCQYYPNYDKCREWLETNLPDEFNKLNLGRKRVLGEFLDWSFLFECVELTSFPISRSLHRILISHRSR